MPVKRVAFVVFLAIGGAIPGAYYARGPLVAASSGEARTFALDDHEARVLDALGAKQREIATGIAPVLTTTCPPEKVLEFVAPRLRAIDATVRDLEVEASRRCGVAVVLSGSTWVEKR
jgi:hypothetical protein